MPISGVRAAVKTYVKHRLLEADRRAGQKAIRLADRPKAHPLRVRNQGLGPAKSYSSAFQNALGIGISSARVDKSRSKAPGMQRHSPSIACWCESAFGAESLHDHHNQRITLKERTALSFLTDEESAALSVRRMILHVVGTEGTFEAQEEQREIEHEPFFL